jgi:thiol-disulfide isomerase/thioredoxin
MNPKTIRNASYCLILCAAVLLTPIINAQELKFKELKSQKDWQIAKDEAKKSDKYIFLDIYATWCGPCKMMDKDVYTNALVSEYFNSGFVNLKIDGESEFGRTLASQYSLTAYPSLYFINPDEKLINRMIGYRDPEALTDAGKAVKDFGKRFMELDELFSSSKLTDSQTDEFMGLLLKFGKKDELAVLAGIKLKSFTEADVINPLNKAVVMAVVSEIDSFPVNVVLKNAILVKTAWGKEDFNQYLSESFDLSMQRAATLLDSALMEKIAGELVPVYMMDNPERIPEAKLTTRKIFFSQTEEWDAYILAVDKYFNEFESGNIRFLYNESYYIVENQLFNPKLLEKSMEWIQKVIAAKPEFDCYFLAAVISTYQDNKEASRGWMSKAESLATTDDERASLDELKKYLEAQ